MLERANIVYRYDGSFEGFLCCVFESFRTRELPAAIECEDTAQETLFRVKHIKTDVKQAQRVRASFAQKISKEAEDLIKKVFVSCAGEKELQILQFLNLGYKTGEKTTKFTTHPAVSPMLRTAQQVGNEAHYSLEFLRFSQFGDFLAAQITPKNSILPYITYHFCDRFPDENFIIYDKNHRVAFLHKETGETEFLFDTEITFPTPDEEEANYRRLWKHFYKTITVEARRNAKLRRSKMPMRYWGNLTEFQDEPAAQSTEHSLRPLTEIPKEL